MNNLIDNDLALLLEIEYADFKAICNELDIDDVQSAFNGE